MTKQEIKQLRSKIITAFPGLDKQDLPDIEKGWFTRFKLVPVELLENAPWNYKGTDAKIQKALEHNMAEQGQVENINVREKKNGMFEVGNGNHRNVVFRKKGQQYALVCDHGTIDEETFIKRCIEQNETKFPVIKDQLGVLIKQLTVKYPIESLAETMPFSKSDLKAFIKGAKVKIPKDVKPIEKTTKTIFIVVDKADHEEAKSRILEALEDLEVMSIN